MADHRWFACGGGGRYRFPPRYPRAERESLHPTHMDCYMTAEVELRCDS